jgi:DNA-directed RNA polymerase subunit RPC12/RpoP
VSGGEHSGWITWWYYKDEETQCFTLRDEPIDLEKWTDTKLIKEFKAPPRDVSGSSEKAKEILRTYVPDAFKEPQEIPKVKCPYCFSSEVQIVPRKFSLLTGFATNKFERVCVRCKRKF